MQESTDGGKRNKHSRQAEEAGAVRTFSQHPQYECTIKRRAEVAGTRDDGIESARRKRYSASVGFDVDGMDRAACQNRGQGVAAFMNKGHEETEWVGHPVDARDEVQHKACH